MPASRIPLKRCTAADPGEGEPVTMPPAKRRRDRPAAPPPAKKAAAVADPATDGEGEDVDGEVYDVEVRVAEAKGGSFGPVETAVWTPDPPAADSEEYRACRNINKSGSCGGGGGGGAAASGSVLTSVSNAGSDGGGGGGAAAVSRPVGRPAVAECKPKRDGAVDKKEDLYLPEDFVLGDVVWAKSGKKSPAWPALVIDPLLHAPEVVLNSCVADALCVMFFGYSGGGHNRVN
jgi:hypothetical protein